MMNTTIRIGGGTMSVQMENRRVILQSRNRTSRLSVSVVGAVTGPFSFVQNLTDAPSDHLGPKGYTGKALGLRNY